MRRSMCCRCAAMIAALSLCLVGAARAGEVGEVDLYDPAVYAPEGIAEVMASEDDVLAQAIDIPEELPEFDLPTGGPEDSAPGAEAVSAAQAQYEMKLGLGEVYATGLSRVLLESDAPQVVSVDSSKGTLTAAGLGIARVTATNSKGEQVAVLVQVLDEPRSMSLDAEALLLGKGEQRQLRLTLPEGTAAGRVAWSSSKKSVVSVDKNGLLVARGTGSATVTAKIYNGGRASVKVRVKKPPTSVKLSAGKAVLGAGETGTLKAKLSGGSASTLTWVSDDVSVVTVDGEGALRAVGPGVTTVRVRTFNRREAACKVTVLEGASPTSMSIGSATVTLGKGEKLQLTPTFGPGESALVAYASSKTAVAKVSSKGVITAKGIGTAKIGVKTHNGLKAVVKVRVVKKPTGVALSEKALTLEVGQGRQLAAKPSSGSASAFRWFSSDASVATVDDQGMVAAVGPGTATVTVATYNKLTASCTVTVTAASTPQPTVEPTAEPTPSDPGVAAMAERLRSAAALGGKRAAITNVVQVLVSAGFEPAFAAGVGANVYSEGTYGLFESSKYIANYLKRPRYFCYLDGGDYYTRVDGEYKLTAVYLAAEEVDSYTGEAEARPRYGAENYYRDNFSGKYVQDIDLSELEAFVSSLAAGSWQGKFGLGLVQWTGGRTKTLVAMYRKHAAADGSLTAAQVAAAENEMILYDFKGSYAGVYNTWRSNNAGNLKSAEAARSAGALVCTKYEVPVDKESKAVTRGSKAVEIYSILMGE